MPRILRMPALAANDASTVLASWPLTEDTAFAAGEAIATAETDKAVVDIEADADGVLLRTLVPEGTRVAIGDPIALIGDPGERPIDIDGLLTELLDPPHSAETEVPAGGGRDEMPHVKPSLAAPRLFASPLARRLAHAAALSIGDITGSGPAGRVVRRDVEAAIANRQTGSTPRPQGGEPDPSTTSAGRFADQPHSRMRAAIASALTASKQQIPHYYLRATCRADNLLALRHELQDEGGLKISLNDLLIKAVARTHRLVPALNVSWHPDVVRSYDDVDIAFAVATPDGLVTPVLRCVDTLAVSTVADKARELADRARLGTLRQSEIEGGSITITNLGMYGVEEFAAIINPSQAAILAIGALTKRPVVLDDQVCVVPAIKMTLSVDHRAVDGAVAAQWLRSLVSVVEHPALALV